MYKVRYIADGMILWHGNAVVGIKGMTLPEMFDDCDCYKLPGNAFDYALSPRNTYTKEQLDFINKSRVGWGDEDEEPGLAPEGTPATPVSSDDDWLPDDDLPF